MKRKVLILLCMITVMLVGCGVTDDNPTGVNSEREDSHVAEAETTKESPIQVNEFTDIRIEIDEEKTSDTKIVVMVSNNSEEELMFGEWFAIEKYEDGVWYQIPIREDIVFNSIGYPVEPNQTRELTFRFDYIYELETFQKYRIVTYFGDDNGDKHYVSDEFQIGILAN